VLIQLEPSTATRKYRKTPFRPGKDAFARHLFRPPAPQSPPAHVGVCSSISPECSFCSGSCRWRFRSRRRSLVEHGAQKFNPRFHLPAPSEIRRRSCTRETYFPMKSRVHRHCCSIWQAVACSRMYILSSTRKLSQLDTPDPPLHPHLTCRRCDTPATMRRI
jgi:hypothetical protein